MSYDPSIAALQTYQQTVPRINTGKVGAKKTAPGGQGPQITGRNPFAQEKAEVADIGLSKKQGYENGLGGTNSPVDANGRPCSFVAIA